MNLSKLATVLGSFSLLTLAALTPDVAHAEEVWASPSASGGPFTDVGDWAVTRGGATYFSVAIPDDYDEFLGASILAIGSGLGGGGTNTFDVEIGVSVAASGDSSSAATFVTQQTITVTEGVLSDIDISAALDLAYLAGADYVAISITPPNGSSKHMNLVGMRFQYGSTDGDTDPTNELNTAFTFAGTTISITDAGGTLSADLSDLEESAEVAANAAAIAQNASDISSNTAAIGSNTAAISANAADIATNAAGISQNASDISANAAAIASNDADIAANAADIAANSADIATNAAGISQNASDISANAADIATNAAGISQNASDISANAADIAANSADIATNAAGISQNASDISANAADIASNDADIAANAAGISQNASDISANAAAIASNDADIAANSAAIAGNDADIAQNSAAISANTANIAANASNISANTAAITSNDADIAQNAAAIGNHIAADGDLNPTNELQSLSLSGSTLSISSGNAVNLSGVSADNLGNHIATTDLNMNGLNIFNAFDIFTSFLTSGQVLTNFMGSFGDIVALGNGQINGNLFVGGIITGTHVGLTSGAVTSYDDDGSRDCPGNRVARGFDVDDFFGNIDRIRFNCAYVR